MIFPSEIKFIDHLLNIFPFRITFITPLSMICPCEIKYIYNHYKQYNDHIPLL